MRKITVKIGGMSCGMCESHINDTLRSNFKVKKVSSSRSKAEAVIICEDDITEEALKRVIGATGYEFLGMSSEPYEKKGLFSRK